MKKYTFELIIREGSDEFWEDIEDRKVTGCEEVMDEIKNCLAEHGFFVGEEENNELILKKFENE